MSGQEQISGGEGVDEIGDLAFKYMMLPEDAGFEKIQCNISRALTDGNWDDLSKWHRVRFRLARLYEQRRIADRIGMPFRSGV